MDNPAAPNVAVSGADPKNAAAPALPAASPAAPAAKPAETPTQQILAGAVDQVTVADSKGRKITTRKLSPIRRTRLFKIIGPDNSRNLPLLGYYSMAVSVTQIGDDSVVFPSKESEIEALLERLGDDGINAVAKGWKDADWADDAEEGDAAAIKN